MTNSKTRGQVRVLDGNRAAAQGVLLCKPDVIAIYPITPQTQLVEALSKYHAQGLLDAEMVEVEGENSAMAVVTGAAAAGGRVFTATSSMGLFFMYDSYTMAAGLRLPVVMVNANRESAPPAGVTAGQQDIMSVRDAGWICIMVENNQEILDSIIMAYRLAEDPEILLPVTVSYDGYYLSYVTDRLEIPAQEDVDRFLALSGPKTRPVLSLEAPKSCGIALRTGEEWTELRYRHQSALERVKPKIGAIEQEFQAIFGRSYGGLIEEYRTDNAEMLLVCMGSHTGTAKVVIDKKRDEGLNIGLIKIRVFRPFPKERLMEVLRGRKAVGVIDRSVCFGWDCGHLFMELKAALSEVQSPPAAVDFIDGIGGNDISIKHIEQMIDILCNASQGKPFQKVNWFGL